MRTRSTLQSVRWSEEIVCRQGDGDYSGALAMLEKYGRTDAEAQRVIASLTHLPVDIRPIYPDRI